MTKVFRPYNIQGDPNIRDWDSAKVYGTQAISEIEDPDGATAHKEITSIPSPFARIDLVKTAFKEVNGFVRQSQNFARLSSDDVRKLIEFGQKKEPTIYHKMVSEALDVAEIFYNYDRFRDRFEILVWDRDVNLDTNTIFGKTIDLYLKADAEGDDSYNFGKMQRIYLLNYIGPDRPSAMNIVGATSPATLFFSSANDLSYVSRNVAFDQDRPFDDAYQPLFRRDFEFQKYLFAFRCAIANFANLFPEVNEYLDMTYRCLNTQQKDAIDQLNANSIDAYDIIPIGANGNDTLDILGHPFHKKTKVSNWQSDFVVRNSCYKGDKMPLVLPVERGNAYANYTYTTANWGSSNAAPFFDGRSLDRRTLPIVGEDYPYLTISDFLTDTIVRIPYEINKTSFFDGGYVCRDSDEKNSFLLPLTSLFFKFFTVNDLRGEVNGKKMFEFIDNTSGIKVILRIPVKKGFVEYSRVYYEGMDPVIENNDGALIDTKLGLGVMPLVRFPENVNKHYRIAFFDRGKSDAFLTFYDSNEGTPIEAKRVVKAQKDLSGRGCSHESYVVESNFDRIAIKVGEIEGYVIPKFKTETGNMGFTFAVDFGTTNTHIEYSTDVNGRKNPIPFNIRESEKQIHKMHTLYTDKDISCAFEQDFMPDTVADKDVFSFPMRTVFAERADINYDMNPIAMADGHIPFLYEKDFTPHWNNIKTELKWGGVHERLLEMHLETLFMLMRNKVVINNGNLSATKVIWFYPASMTEAKVNQFKKIWRETYEKYFGDNAKDNVISISESKAPYLHFITTQGAADEAVTIDVGGGTTDVFVSENREDKMLLSFRYASNAIFGDGYNSNPSKNGFVCKYKEIYKEMLRANGYQELLASLEQIEQQQKSSDIVAFLFSLVGDKVANNRELDFLRKLASDDKMRYVFVLFYGSILYFIARTMKAKGLKKPKTIAFSGNGAKTINVLSGDEDTLSKFAKLIFDGVYQENGGRISVMMESNPKVATCKGGIESPNPQPYDSINDIKTVIVGNSFDDVNAKLTYHDIAEKIQNDVVNSVMDFLGFLFDLHKNNNDFLINSLAVDSSIFDQVKGFCLGEEGRQELEVSLSKGLRNKKEMDKVGDDTLLEETLFFYPMVGLLHELAYKIYKGFE